MPTRRLLPLTNWQRQQAFGRFRFVPSPSPTNPERIVITDNWPERNIDTVRCPQLEKLFNRSAINLNYKVVDPFLKLWAEWENRGLLCQIESFNGTWVPRLKRGKTKAIHANLSNHAYGTAFDINAKQWPMGKVVPMGHLYRMLVPIAEKHGFFWGGYFSRPDGMHFEYVGASR